MASCSCRPVSTPLLLLFLAHLLLFITPLRLLSRHLTEADVYAEILLQALHDSGISAKCLLRINSFMWLPDAWFAGTAGPLLMTKGT